MKQYCLFLLLISPFARGQDTGFQRQIVLATDNDYFVWFNQTDRYYTYGLHGRYEWVPNGTNKPLLKESKARYNGLSFDLKAYTPDYQHKENEIERPYAGWSYFTYLQTYCYDKKIIKLGLQAGVIGPASGAGSFQNWFHSTISNDPKVEGWDENQIENFVGANFIAGYYKTLKSTESWQIMAQSNFALGNVHIYAEPAISIAGGLLNSPGSSLSTGSTLVTAQGQNEIYLKLTAGARFLAYDATLQDNLFRNRDPLDFSTINHISIFAAPSIEWTNGRMIGQIMFRFSRGQVETENYHHYGRISLGYRW